MSITSKPTYTIYELKQELTRIFRSVWFDDLTQKIRIQDSYFDNFFLLVDYAREHGIDEMSYIRSIADVLSEHKKNIR